ncbi:MAG: type II 3-dehydroquinate dehydratase [Arenicellales bacterium]|jgi:3-dehydroquinate dehydratase-2|nr:type II 3-dehydroquinate dehydratase [Arenicellales bacterium]
MPDILLLHGPNLNLLGEREPGIYGRQTLADINEQADSLCTSRGAMLEVMQSNAESELVERVQRASGDGVGFIVINPAAFTHTSVALRDALAAVSLPFIEVHLSNPHAREAFRRQSFFSDLAQAVICGFGPRGYEVAIDAALNQLGFAGTKA